MSSLFKGLLQDRRGYQLNKGQLTSILTQIDTIMRKIEATSFSNNCLLDQTNNSLEPGRQQDAIEFMKTFLEIMNEENNRISTKPPYRQLNTAIENGEDFKKSIQEKVIY